MRSAFLVTLSMALLVVFAGQAFAGKIFGDISIDGKPLAAGTKIQITKAGSTDIVDKVETDKFGSYKLMVKEEGKMTLTVLYEGKPLQLAVFSNKEATRYDLVIEKKEGKASVRRK